MISSATVVGVSGSHGEQEDGQMDSGRFEVIARLPVRYVISRRKGSFSFCLFLETTALIVWRFQSPGNDGERPNSFEIGFHLSYYFIYMYASYHSVPYYELDDSS